MKHTILFILCLLLTLGLQAQPNNDNSASRPKVGVVLGGGGARGAAHIGVLKYLEELGIPVDYVAGTSMGSIIGGLYAMGYDPDEMTQLISSIPWNEYIGNKIDRTTMTQESRLRSSTTLLTIPFSLESLGKSDPNATLASSLPGAYVNNSGLINLFNDLCVGYQEEMDFNKMPIPFACVATDLISGEEVVMRSGVVPQAMRASMAIPGVFSPVIIGNQVMVDGGLVNNFPADVLREMGADIIIGVEVTSEKTWTPEMLKSLPQVMARLLTNVTNAKRKTNRGLCDIHIVPDCSGYGMLSFTPDAIETLVNRGYAKAQENQQRLMDVKQAVDKAAGHPVSKELHAPRSLNLMEYPVCINGINIHGVDAKYNRWMVRKSGLKPGGKYSKEEIEKGINVFRGTGCFDDITYNLLESDTAYALNINMIPASPNVIGFGARYDTEEGAALLFTLGLNEKAFDGHKLSLTAKLSYNPRISARYTYSRHNLANFNIFYDLRNEHYKDRYNYVDFINFHHYQQRIGASISQYHMLNMNASLGAYLVSTTYDKLGITGDDFEVYLADNTQFVPFIEYQFDNLDDAYFAKRGFYGKVRGEWMLDINSRENNSQNASLALQGYLTPGGGRVTFIPQAYGRYFFGSPQYYNLTNFYGGEVAGRHYEHQLPFIGINYTQDGAPVMGILRCDIRYNFYKKHYLTAMYNVLYEKYSTFNYYTHGAGLKYSYNSPLGPISLTGQWESLTHKFNAYFSFGYTF
jgi:NTE family protein